MDVAMNQARLDVRLRSDLKEQILRAASIRGQSLTDFVTSTLAEASEDVIARHRTITLSARDYDLFLAALDADGEPNPALRKAAEEYRRDPW